MAHEEIKTASFDHVSDQGEMVFVCDHKYFAVKVDNTLDRAILEAKQVLEEEQGAPIPQASSALPISAIQAAVRAGESTQQVAQEFAVNEAIVRRFANPIETEKKYAIEQFLSMSAPKHGSAPTNEEALNRALEAVNVPMSAVSWTATRRNHSPWKIRAAFQAEGRAVEANWTWNMKENTITCLNKAAKHLLEGSSAFISEEVPAPVQEDPDLENPNIFRTPMSADPAAAVDESASHAQLSATLELAAPPMQPVGEQAEQVSESELTDQAQTTDEQAITQPPTGSPAALAPQQGTPLPPPQETANAPQQAAPEQDKAEDQEQEQEQQTAVDSHEPSSLTAWMYGGKRRMKAQGEKAAPTTTASSSTQRSSQGSARQPSSAPTHQGQADASAQSAQTSQEGDSQADSHERRPGSLVASSAPSPEQATHQTGSTGSGEPHSEASAKAENAHQTSHKKSGRSAVPSWDEILFGE
ncbi:hypothetical protein KIM372_10630 [Bombiscardovia nodaiensis]|uniref:DUF3071 domain-containing protein n=1 Tax=Bombiscardovia nodaiensis TaxID=2932181 RepID=A0ABM8B8E8_9BIFI|nr:hypothetical protein KIM372_10630 [Bombiscardovia nodaiensis]